MIIQEYPVICNGIHDTTRHLKPMCKRCPLYSRVKQPVRKSWIVCGIKECIIKKDSYDIRDALHGKQKQDSVLADK